MLGIHYLIMDCRTITSAPVKKSPLKPADWVANQLGTKSLGEVEHKELKAKVERKIARIAPCISGIKRKEIKNPFVRLLYKIHNVFVSAFSDLDKLKKWVDRRRYLSQTRPQDASLKLSSASDKSDAIDKAITHEPDDYKYESDDSDVEDFVDALDYEYSSDVEDIYYDADYDAEWSDEYEQSLAVANDQSASHEEPLAKTQPVENELVNAVNESSSSQVIENEPAAVDNTPAPIQAEFGHFEGAQARAVLEEKLSRIFAKGDVVESFGKYMLDNLLPPIASIDIEQEKDGKQKINFSFSAKALTGTLTKPYTYKISSWLPSIVVDKVTVTENLVFSVNYQDRCFTIDKGSLGCSKANITKLGQGKSNNHLKCAVSIPMIPEFGMRTTALTNVLRKITWG